MLQNYQPAAYLHSDVCKGASEHRPAQCTAVAQGKKHKRHVGRDGSCGEERSTELINNRTPFCPWIGGIFHLKAFPCISWMLKENGLHGEFSLMAFSPHDGFNFFLYIARVLSFFTFFYHINQAVRFVDAQKRIHSVNSSMNIGRLKPAGPNRAVGGCMVTNPRHC